jgi:hypothetical protein
MQVCDRIPNKSYRFVLFGEATVMTQILLDASSVSKLSNVTQSVELCDQSGRVLGRFVPNLADEYDPREAYPFIDKTMADADADDPTLESYQRHRKEAKQ